MKRIGGIIAVLSCVLTVSGQLTISDNATTGSQHSLMTFYNLQSGQKTVASNSDWHLAVSVRPSVFPSNTLQGTTLRINEAFGMQVFEVNNFTADSFYAPIDTTGFHIWQRVNDADSVLDEGALNTGKNIGLYNYGWGEYSGPPLHNVVGNKIYFFQLPNRHFQKILIEELDRDTAWNIRIANLDNSNLRTIHISKRDYPGKNFVYLNLLNDEVYDKEPAFAWDLQFLKYAATDVAPMQTSNVVGVWVNKGRSVARRDGIDVSDNSYNGLNFSSALNAIGWDWKYAVNNQLLLSGKDFDQFASNYRITDSLAYFVQSASGEIYKLVFTGYEGPSTGIVLFETTRFVTSSISETPSSVLNLFPNPSASVLNISHNLSPANARVYDTAGRMVLESLLSDPTSQLDIASLENGTYILSLTTAQTQTLRKFSVVH